MNQEFIDDVIKGLSSKQKYLPSKYIYDSQGSILFQKIMEMPEYYVADCEKEILDKYKSRILYPLANQHFDLIELGAGDGTKTKILLEYLTSQEQTFRYIPIDISEGAIKSLEKNVRGILPKSAFRPQIGEYFSSLKQFSETSSSLKLILFLGASIGNLTLFESQKFLKNLYKNLNSGDRVLIGLDLKKDPSIIQQAYDDPAGITASFNLNLLTRMNRELGADFKISQYKHWECYNPRSGEANSYIISKVDQDVHFASLNLSFSFRKWEEIWVEVSRKFNVKEFQQKVCSVGFQVREIFIDEKAYFCDMYLVV